MLISYSFLRERAQPPFFDLWGVSYSVPAAAQLDYYGFRIGVAARDVTNGALLPTPVPVDDVAEWPL
jgi:hypothetical protein